MEKSVHLLVLDLVVIVQVPGVQIIINVVHKCVIKKLVIDAFSMNV
jgi:hypothetical protein